MSTDQTTPPPASATTLAGGAGTASPGTASPGTASPTGTASPGTADAGPDEAGLGDAGLGDAGLSDAGPDGSGLADAGPDEAADVGAREGFAVTEPVAAGSDHQPPVGLPGQTSVEPARQPVGSSWQAEASGRLVAMSFPGARRVAGWLFWVVFPLLCLAAIQTSVSNVADHLGNKPTGIRGTFVVQPRSCSQGFCSFGGLFTSDDHTIRNLPLLGDPRWHTADVHRVTYDPRSVEVAALPGHWDPTPSVMATFGALTYLVLLGYFVREQRRSGRSWRRLASSA